MVKGMATLVAEVSSMSRAVGFYRDLLGLPFGYVSEHWADFSIGANRLGLHPPYREGYVPDQVKSGWALGIEVEDIAELRRRLEEAGVRVLAGYHQVPGGVVLDFADPDGNLIQAIQHGAKVSDLA